MQPTDLTGIPTQYQVYIIAGLFAFKMLCEFVSIVKKGGGLKHIIVTFWAGENVPTAVAQDYLPPVKTQQTTTDKENEN